MTIVGGLYFLSLPIAFLVSDNAVTRIWEFAFVGVGSTGRRRPQPTC